MPDICPAILAATKEEYHQQLEKVAGFAERVQIDLTDGEFAHTKTIGPEDSWWPVGVKADFHLMYKYPSKAIDVILEHKPHMIIIHAEAEGGFAGYAEKFDRLGVKLGLALLQKTSVESVYPALDHVDHVLIFSGDLGSYGGHANLDLLNKVHALKHHRRDLEIGWDGGINDRNISHLAAGGVDVFNVGGFLQQSPDPAHDYRVLQRIAEETGTT
jgi:ribulose-phosphate 3-epimerase